MNIPDQNPTTIYNFKRGNIVTRIIASRPYSNMFENEIPDYNYIGIPLTYIGILNGCAYFEKIQAENVMSIIFAPLLDIFKDEKGEIPKEFKNLSKSPKKKSLIALPLSIWEEGWTLYYDPKKIFDLEEDTEIISSSNNEKNLDKKLKDAIEKDDFETAKEIKKKIEELKNKNDNKKDK